MAARINGDIVTRYTQARWLILTGTTEGTATDSTYAFCRDVLQYDLAGFFFRNSARLKTELENVLTALMESDGDQ